MPGDQGPQRRGPTIYDVARECGVAPSTVSRAFSRPGRVNAETAARIRAVAETMGYRANPLARALPTGHTSLLALIVSDVTNPFFFEIIRGAEQAAAAAGYTVLVSDVQESAQAERQALDRVVPLVEGVVLATSRMSDSTIRVMAKQRPTVVLNRVLTEVPSVVTDNSRGMRRAVEHLGELGHHTVAYAAGPEASWADGMRWRSMREAGYELELKVRRLGRFEPTVRGGLDAAHALAKAPATAVVCYNDLVAIGLMRGLSSMGARVPAEVSVVGFDNIFGSDFCSPPLTTVAAPLRALGSHAVRALLRELGHTTPHAVRATVLPAQLVVRGSTAKPGRRRHAWTKDAAAPPEPVSGPARASGSASAAAATAAFPSASSAAPAAAPARTGQPAHSPPG
jgi:LacI family transcriptional regulator